MTQEEILQSPKLQMEAALIRKCSEETEFRGKVLADPKGMLELALGQKLPEDMSIVIHEEDLRTLHFSIPPTRESLQKELSDEQLEQVAGGTDPGSTIILSALTLAIATAGLSGLVTGTSALTAGVTIKSAHW